MRSLILGQRIGGHFFRYCKKVGIQIIYERCPGSLLAVCLSDVLGRDKVSRARDENPSIEIYAGVFYVYCNYGSDKELIRI